MLALLIFSIIVGVIVAAISGVGFLFWVFAIGVFVCGLPAALVVGFIYGVVDHAQDRADEREMMREIAEDERMDRYLDKLDELNEDIDPDIYIDNRRYYDNRQVHYHGKSSNSETNRIQGRRKNS